jgi:hypothetical protein
LRANPVYTNDIDAQAMYERRPRFTPGQVTTVLPPDR